MSIKKNILWIIATLISLFAYNLSAAEASTAPDCSFSANRLTEISARRMPGSLNHDLDQLQLVVYRNGEFSPIVHQFESSDFQNTTRAHTLSARDRLFIRTTDLGQIPPNNLTPPNYLDRIIVRTAQGNNAAYVVSVTPSENNTAHIHYSKRTGLLETDCFKLKTSPKNFLIWNGFFYKPLAEQANRNLLDSFKLRLSAQLLGPLPRMDADNSDIIPVLVASDEGPLRSRILMKATVTVLKIPVAHIDMLWTVENLSIENQVTVSIPQLMAKMVAQPYVSMSLDGRQLNGSSVVTSVNAKNPTRVDGFMDAQEVALNNRALDPRNNWIQLRLPMPLTISSQVILPPNFSSPFTLLYQDDKNLADPPERFTGQEPNVGYQMTNFPLNGQFVFKFSLFFSNGTEAAPI